MVVGKKKEGDERGEGIGLRGAPKAPNGGAEGATPPEGEGNPAEGGYFASLQ